MFNGYNSIYYITIGLQAICLIHSVRRGTLNKWLWIVVFLPVVGSLVYIFTEMFSSRIRKPNIDVGAVINPGGRIKKMEEALRFSDTFNNRIQLADAYLAGGQTERAIQLYEESLTGAFVENEHALGQLILAYYQAERYNDAVKAAKKISKHPQFIRSKAHLTYALSLENLGYTDQAEAEFKSMIGRFSYFEQRYEYGMFLLRQKRQDEAEKVFTTMLEEEPQLSSMERRPAKLWFGRARNELKTMA